MIGEPSEMKVVYAHKCLNIFKVTIGFQQVERDVRGFNRKIDFTAQGKSAHGSYPHLGVNAILSGLRFLEEAAQTGFEMRFTKISGGDTVNKVPDRAAMQFYVGSHQFEDFKRFFRETANESSGGGSFNVELGGVGDTGVKFLPEVAFACLNEIVAFFKTVSSDFEKVKDSSYNPAFSTANLGQMKQTAGGLELFYDLRLLPDLQPDEIMKHIQGRVREIAAKYSGLNVTVIRDRMNPGLNMKSDSELVQICQAAMKDAGIPPTIDKKATSTEAAQYFQAGFDAVVYGPGVSHGNSHSPNEYNILEHLEKSITFYEKLIERVCL
jgi:acetylornithine deacetylase/succinyl-diaminopimelate desuccinylase-like protein